MFYAYKCTYMHLLQNLHFYAYKRRYEVWAGSSRKCWIKKGRHLLLTWSAGGLTVIWLLINAYNLLWDYYNWTRWRESIVIIYMHLLQNLHFCAYKRRYEVGAGSSRKCWIKKGGSLAIDMSSKKGKWKKAFDNCNRDSKGRLSHIWFLYKHSGHGS